ncbi:nose resistant to fluoxetine protein 6 [Ditylenchus destructor]|uniref:Nose resistant to fluoxetine protein 6 n=1 Tax=Ditylenchus destructor TaxID=166010 RepID=A0AAD4NKH9_9BILA|nr:nose resistant to fluoxetine protein 6 [Ditylenchus destructor]
MRPAHSLFYALFVAIIHLARVNSCLLCPLRIPLRPKPLDQFRLPSIQKIIETADSITRLCNIGTNGTAEDEQILKSVGEKCRNDVSHLFCSLTALIDFSKRQCPGSDNPNECAQCQRETAEIYDNNSWILTWVDSIGKMPSGISDGNYHWLGDFEQCQRLKDDKLFNGQYCLLEFEVPDVISSKGVECASDDHSSGLEVNLGICLPAGCNLDETKRLVEFVAEHEIDVHCEPARKWPLSAKIFVTCILIWLLLILTATLVNVGIGQKLDNVFERLCNAICLQKNVRESLRTTRAHSHQYHALQGIQVVSVVLLIFGNLFFLVMPYLENVGYAYYLSELAISQPVVNFSFHIDALLALAALRLGSKHMEEFSTIRRLLLHLVRHFFRIWPTYAFIVGFIAIIYVRLGEGPMWSHSVNDISARCSQTWWANLLLINNLFGTSMTCLDGGFLISLEAQLFIIGTVLLFLSLRIKNKIFNVILWIGIAISVLYTFITALYYQTPETLIPTVNQRNESFDIFANRIYLNPVSRMAPFLLGIFLIRHFENSFLFSNPHVFKALAPLLSFLCVLLTVCIIWAPYLMSLYGSQLHSQISALYCATHRLLWAFVILCTAHLLNRADSNNSLNSFLGWRIFHPLSKLIYIVFLVSEPVALSLFSSLHRPIYATPLSTMLTSVGTICCSFMIAFLIELFIGRPIRNIVAIFYKHSYSEVKMDE